MEPNKMETIILHALRIKQNKLKEIMKSKYQGVNIR